MLSRLRRLPSPALAISVIALVAAIGGGAFAAASSDNSKDRKIAKKVANRQITKRAKTLSVLHASTADNATNATNATNAQNAQSAKNADTAANADALQNHPASDFIQGSGAELHNRITVAAGQSQQLLSLGLGHIDGNCAANGTPTLSFTAEVSPINLVASSTDFGSPNGTAHVDTANGLAVGNTFTESNPAITPQSVTFQLANTVGSKNHVATAWTSGQDIGTTSCIFIGQALTTG